MQNNKYGKKTGQVTQTNGFKSTPLRIMTACLGVLVLGISLTGCIRSVSPNFYTLTPPMAPLIHTNVKFIKVMPVSIPERLNTPLIVLQNQNGKTSMQEYQRWSSSFSDELQSALSASLQQKLGAIDTYNNGLGIGQASYNIATEFSRFDIVQNEQQTAANIDVMMAWSIQKNPSLQNGNALKSLNCRMNFQTNISEINNHFINIVNGAQNALNRVTDAIAASATALEANQKPTLTGVVCS